MNGLTQDRFTHPAQNRNQKRNAHRAPGNSNSSHQEIESSFTGRTTEALSQTVEREVIPRLMIAHRTHRTSMLHADNTQRPDGEDVVEFAALLAARDVTEARSRIQTARAKGMSLEAIYLHLLLPAARRLSDLWDADLCHYEEIAVGMSHLQQMLHDLSLFFFAEGQCASCDRKALLLSAPGEQNMLGGFMVTEFYRCVAAEFFHRAGWEVWRGVPTSRSQLISLLSSQWFDVVDISCSCQARLPVLADDLAKIRKASRNRGVNLIVGGPIFTDHPEFARQVGADACSGDPADALAQAEMLITLRGC